jgi:dual specificity tyrosine-phosphorylation-regulated kinase 2/3/4
MCFSFFKQRATGLRILYDHRLVHCDIKPENLMRDCDNEIVKIIDFGCSATLETQSIISTPFSDRPKVRTQSNVGFN